MSSEDPAAVAGLEITPNPHPRSRAERLALMENPGFGRVHSDHMVVIPYHKGDGWGRGELRAYAPLPMDPASLVFHYAQAIFEGFKAYHQPDGGVSCFRPAANARRFADSARRMAIPPLPEDRFVAVSDLLIRQDREWVPTTRGHSLYMRPLIIATQTVLGVRPSDEYLFLLLALPSGNYFAGGVKPVAVWVSEEYVRAAPGGTGAAKCAGNYAASLLAQQDAEQQGCQQVVWLDAIHRCYVEEIGGMNLFFVMQDGNHVTLVTPELTGTLLPGITRASLLELGRELGFAVEERKVSLDEWRTSAASGRMTEAFACGTAAVITPIGQIRSRSGGWQMGDGTSGPVSLRLRDALLDIQHGVAPDTHGWMHRLV